MSWNPVSGPWRQSPEGLHHCADRRLFGKSVDFGPGGDAEVATAVEGGVGDFDAVATVFYGGATGKSSAPTTHCHGAKNIDVT